jgi:hypothetical protein
VRLQQIYNVDQTVEVVRNVVSKTPITAPLRVFTIGIGSGASTELCESLAVAGNGLHWMMVDGEPLATGGIVDAMQAQLVEEMSLDWGGPSPGKGTGAACSRSSVLPRIFKYCADFPLPHRGCASSS